MLADTDFVIDFLRGDPRTRARLEQVAEEGDELVIPAPVVYELHRGAALARVPEEERRRIAEGISGRPVAELTREAAAVAGEWDGRLRRLGRPIDPEDTMIAGIALTRDESLLTRNRRHFGRIEGLQLIAY